MSETANDGQQHNKWEELILKECSKSISRRLSDSNFINHYFVGDGIDIGGKPDPLCLYQDLFSKINSIKTWDWEDGDAQFLNGIPENKFDFVHSSHCLEHLIDPRVGLKNWIRILRPGGYLIITVPDEDLYEQGIFPSTFNLDHKWTFTIFKDQSWSKKSINILDLIRDLGMEVELLRLELLFSTYRFDLPRFDQTLTPIGECGIEFVIRKRLAKEISDKGRWRKPTIQPDKEIRLHLNQYRDDIQTMKQNNKENPPFKNSCDI